jgi:hypothetical protein
MPFVFPRRRFFSHAFAANCKINNVINLIAVQKEFKVIRLFA